MRMTLHFLKHFLESEDGPTAVEYAVMLAMIVLACIGAINSLGGASADSFTDSATKIQAAMNP